MKIELRDRTEQHVRIYFERVQDPVICKMLPQSVVTLEQALINFANTQKPNATSFGKTIYADGVYIGDVWCYGIAMEEVPQCMVSYCIFDQTYWVKGIAAKALAQFLVKIRVHCCIHTVGAFTFSANKASIRVLEKNGFLKIETFCENGIESLYMEKEIATSGHSPSSQ